MKNEKAFPNPHLRDDSGITIRDYFAAKALQGMFANPDDSHEHYDLSYEDYVKEIARCSYKMADAMLAAREKT
jgi:hypothetical protein